MRKPSVTTNPVANGYTEHNERIVEFNNGHQPGGLGGLIAIRRSDDDARLSVSVYRTDENVDVIVGREVDTYIDGVYANGLVNWWRKLPEDERAAYAGKIVMNEPESR